MNDKTLSSTVRLGRRPLGESIRQNMRIILLTARGEVPFRPRFGLGAERLLGGGMQQLDVAYEVADQLARYEKRIRVRQVVTTELEPGRRCVTIRYEILDTAESQTLTLGN